MKSNSNLDKEIALAIIKDFANGDKALYVEDKGDNIYLRNKYNHKDLYFLWNEKYSIYDVRIMNKNEYNLFGYVITVQDLVTTLKTFRPTWEY